ncbi:MAG: hypothetical protein HUU27_01295 [Phycisphaerae bacterium]|nr:hypothetical protein [Phycisphaerae bacterium]
MPIKLGMEAKLYYKPGGQSGGGAWNELTNVRDVTLTLETGEADSHHAGQLGLAGHGRHAEGGHGRIRDGLGHGRRGLLGHQGCLPG